MARTSGARNTDYDEKRAALAATAAQTLLQSTDAAERPSLRELSRSTGVSVNNLRHYFEDRDGVVAAAFEALGTQGAPYLARLRALEAEPPEVSLPAVVQELVTHWEDGLGALHQTGLVEGLGSVRLGPSYVREILEPTLQGFEGLLAAYVAQGRLAGTPRTMALALLSPVLLALLHQGALGGAGCRPLDLPAFADEHVAGFLRAYRVS